MVNRVRSAKAQSGGDYFPARSKLKFISSGCTLLDCILGGGWPLGRVSNVVGDKSTGKTLLAIEATANFALQFPKGRIWYREGEASFDEPYAERLGLPLDRVDFGPEGIDSVWDTVEAVFVDLEKQLDKAIKGGFPGLYIIDSLDALSSDAELERDVGQGSYNLEKQKRLGELFRRLVRKIKQANVHLMFISQVRDKIGVVFGDKHTRSGGKALDFYASQIIWLSHLGTLTRTIKGIKRASAVRIMAKCKKNKVVESFRDCQFTIRFGLGVDDLTANLAWLKEIKRLDVVGLKKDDQIIDYISDMERLGSEDYRKQLRAVSQEVINLWETVEASFRPTIRKYG